MGTDSTFFVVGSERSGTTLFRLMLAGHPKIAMAGQFEFAVNKLGDDGREPPMAEYRRYLENERLFKVTGFTIDESLGYHDLLHSFFPQIDGAHSSQVQGGVVHYHFNRLLHLWPDARFIHFLRDGRDASRSAIGMGWANNVWHGASRWVDAEQTWARMAPAVAVDRRIQVRYEDLVADPRAELERVVDFLGVGWHDELLTYPARSAYKTPDPTRATQWRSKMTEKEMRLVEGRIGSMLVERGYELSGLEPHQPSSLEHRVRSAKNRLARPMWRLSRFGVRLWALETISRRLRLKSWERYAAEMNAISQERMPTTPPAASGSRGSVIDG